MLMEAFENICLSGGAEGADSQFGMCAGSRGDSVVHWGFAGQRSSVPEQERVELSEDQLEAADPFLRRANLTLKRRLGKGFVRNLLRRNWYQVQHSERVYAVTSIEGGQVSGGTGWAVAMFLDRWKRAPCECYVFDQITEGWFAWKGEWVAVESVPEPYGVWTGIGSRKLTLAGKEAIRSLLGYRSQE